MLLGKNADGTWLKGSESQSTTYSTTWGEITTEWNAELYTAHIKKFKLTPTSLRFLYYELLIQIKLCAKMAGHDKITLAIPVKNWSANKLACKLGFNCTGVALGNNIFELETGNGRSPTDAS